MSDLQTDEPNWEVNVIQEENDHLRRMLRLMQERLGESPAEHMMRLADEIMDLRKKVEEFASKLGQARIEVVEVQREKAALLDELIPLRVAVEAAKTRNERRRAKRKEKEQANVQG